MNPVPLPFSQSVKKQPWILAYARMTEGERRGLYVFSNSLTLSVSRLREYYLSEHTPVVILVGPALYFVNE